MPTNVNKTPSNLDIDNQDVNTSVSELKNLIESHVTNPAVQKYMIDLLTQLIKQVQSEERENILAQAREQYDKESKDRKNTRKPFILTDVDGNIYALALLERVVASIIQKEQE